MQSFSIKRSQVTGIYRLEPSYYYYNVVVKERSMARGINYVKLHTMTEMISDGEHSAIPRQKKAGVRYLYGRNIKDGIINFDPNTDSSYISTENYHKFKRIHLNEDDVLMTIVGTIGKVAVYKKSYVGTAGIPRHIAKIRLKEDSIFSNHYLVAFLLSKLGKRQITNISTGNNQPLLSIANIETLDIPIISQKEHDKITKDSKRCIECEEEALALIKEAQSVFYSESGIHFSEVKEDLRYTAYKSELVKNNLWISLFNYPLYVNTVKEMAAHWPLHSLGSLVEVFVGDEVGSDSYNEYVEKRSSDIPFVRTSDIINYELDQFPDFYVSNSTYVALAQGVQAGDILFSKDGKIGMVGMVTASDKMIVSSGFAILRLKPEAIQLGVTPEYLFTVLTLPEIGIYASKRRTVVASTIPHLREDRLKEMEIPIIGKSTIGLISEKVKAAFELKDEKKRLQKSIRESIDKLFEEE